MQLIAYIISRFKEMSIFNNYIFFKYSSNSDNLILLVKLEIYTSFEELKTNKVIFLIITLCGSIYVRFVFSVS